MHVEIAEKPRTYLPIYGRIPISFEVREILDCTPIDDGLGGISLTKRVLATPYGRDYDSVEGQGPERWAERFDMSNWGLFLAMVNGEPVGGATLAFDTVGVDMLEGRRDLAVLWDLRVAPAVRGHGIGAELFRAAAAWARDKGCTRLKVETQNINVPACRFYAKRGCALGAINRFAYPALPDEAQLLWYKELDPRDAARLRS